MRPYLLNAGNSRLIFQLFISTLIVCPALQAQEATNNPPLKLEEVVVTSSPLQTELFQSAQPATVLSKEQLTNQPQGSLGQTLNGQPGISSSSFGPGASRPIIRGLGGDRVRILENGVGTQDVSNTSPDHAVTVETALVDKIEVIRGPASLLYGTSAVGGVVNVFDNRIPELMPDRPLSGTAELRGGTVDNESLGLVSLNAPAGPFAVHLDALKRNTEDIEIPGFARTSALREVGPPEGYPEPKGKLPFSDSDTENLTFGTSYIKDSGFLGFAVSDYTTDYGVPNGEDNISIDAERQRADVHGKLFDISDSITSMDLKVGVVDYKHTEYEGEEAGTNFRNKGVDSRYEVAHKLSSNLEGVIGTQYQYSDFEAVGEEAFQPPTKTNIGSIFVFEELSLNKTIKLQLGGRFDYQDIQANGYTPLGSEISNDVGRSFPTYSQSAGVVWTPVENYALALSIAHTERAPSGQELFADGPHIATGAFEIGDPNLDTEKSLGIDLTLRKKTGRVTGSIGGFYNRFTDYIGLIPNGQVEDDLPVYEFKSLPADFYGFESQIAYHFLDSNPEERDISIDYQPDWVWAENRDSDEALPRMPPLRMKWGINYKEKDLLAARLEVQHVFEQDRTAQYETKTPSYTMLNINLSKELKIAKLPVTLFANGTNLLGQKARESTSFIKDVAPLPGAGVEGGIRIKF